MSFVQAGSQEKGVVVVVVWEESERGWGERPDGYSLHLTPESVLQFVEDYWATMPDEVPDEYSRPTGEVYATLVESEIYTQVAASKNGIRFYGQPPPGV